MSQTAAMLDSYPADLGGIYRNALAASIDACYECAQRRRLPRRGDGRRADQVHPYRPRLRRHLRSHRIRTSRHTGYDAGLTKVVLQACRTACASCAAECEGHAGMHEHCRICADTCRRCEQACADLLASLGTTVGMGKGCSSGVVG